MLGLTEEKYEKYLYGEYFDSYKYMNDNVSELIKKYGPIMELTIDIIDKTDIELYSLYQAESINHNHSLFSLNEFENAWYKKNLFGIHHINNNENNVEKWPQEIDLGIRCKARLVQYDSSSSPSSSPLSTISSTPTPFCLVDTNDAYRIPSSNPPSERLYKEDEEGFYHLVQKFDMTKKTNDTEICQIYSPLLLPIYVKLEPIEIDWATAATAEDDRDHPHYEPSFAM